MSIQKQLLSILEGLPKQVHLVAVSKTKPNADIEEAYAAGQRIFGENKIQEMTQNGKPFPRTSNGI